MIRNNFVHIVWLRAYKQLYIHIIAEVNKIVRHTHIDWIKKIEIKN